MITYIFNIFVFEFLLKQKKIKENVFILIFFISYLIFLYEFDIKSYYFIFRFFDCFIMYYFRLFFLSFYYDYLMVDSYILSQLKFDLYKRKFPINLNSDGTFTIFLIKVFLFYYCFSFFFLFLIFDSLKRMNFITEYDFALKGYFFVYGNFNTNMYPIYLTPKGYNKVEIYKNSLIELNYKTLDSLHFGEDFFFRDEWFNIEEFL